MRLLLAVLLSTLAVPFSHAGDFAYLVRNIAQIENGSLSNPPDFAVGDTLVYFVAREDEFGEELYVTDGTAEGTRLVKDFNPGPGTADVRGMVTIGDTAFFRARVAPYFEELWKSDGTEEGTVLVKDLWPGGQSQPFDLYAADSYIVFRGAGEGIGRELGISDGSEEGTFLVDLNPGEGDSNPQAFASLGDLVFFVANTPDEGLELWVTDGTAQGTGLFRDFRPGPDSSQPLWLTEFDGFMYFTVQLTNISSQRQLWRSDGTEDGTEFVSPLNARELTPTPDGLYFVADAGFPIGAELHRLDRVTGDISLVKDINPGSGNANAPDRLVALGNRVVFSANDGEHGYEPWVSDGTEEGTFMLRDIIPGPATSNPFEFVASGNKVFFLATDSALGDEIWVTDGTPAGTMLLKDILPGPDSSYPGDLTDFNGTLIFGADDGLNGREPWLSDGTPAGTRILKTINDKTSSSQPSFLFRVGDQVLFSADNGIIGSELWITDGTDEGTSLVKDINPGQEGSSPLQFADLNGTILFSATGAGIGRELFKTDLTGSGTVLVKDIRPGSNGSTPSSITVMGSAVYFSATDDTIGDELWRSDGTEGGTQLVKDINEGAGDSFPDNLTALGSTLFFSAQTEAAGYELWKSDGTEGGTQLVRNINPGDADSDPRLLTAVGNTLFFAATTANDGRELWKSDGTNGGTVMVRNINPGAASSEPDGLISYNGMLLFAANDGANGRELWKSDGTFAGTVMVKDIFDGPTGSEPSLFVEAGGLVYFVANAPGLGTEVWLTDGTEAGTRLAFDARPGAAGSSPQNLSAADDAVYYSAIGLGIGRELYRTDGSPAGSRLVRDIFPGETGSFPSNMLWLDGLLLFQANNGAVGAELWAAVTGAPQVESIALVGPSDTNANTVSFTVTFTENVTGVDTGDFLPTILGGSLAGVSVSGVTGSGAVYTVTVSTGTGDGEFRLDLIDNGTIQKDASPALPLVGIGTEDGSFEDGESVAIDRTPPVVTVDDVLSAASPPTLLGNTDTLSAVHVLSFNGLTAPAVAFPTGGGQDRWSAATAPIGPLPEGVNLVQINATDGAGNVGSATGTIIVDLTPPQITLNGLSEIVLVLGQDTYVELGATVTDNLDPNPALEISGSVNDQVEGTYILTYVGRDWVNRTTPQSRIRRVDVVSPTGGGQATIGPNGGILFVESGPLANRATINVPPGLLPGFLQFTMEFDDNPPSPPPGFRMYSPARLGPAGAQFDGDVLVRLPFNYAPDGPGANPVLFAYYFNENEQQWLRDGITGPGYLPDLRVAEFGTTHFTTFAILTYQGDINLDGFVNAVDVQLVINAALGISVEPLDPNVDADPDGAANAIDVQVTINRALGIL